MAMGYVFSRPMSSADHNFVLSVAVLRLPMNGNGRLTADYSVEVWLLTREESLLKTM